VKHQVSKSQFKLCALECFRQVQRTKCELIVAERGRRGAEGEHADGRSGPIPQGTTLKPSSLAASRNRSSRQTDSQPAGASYVARRAAAS